LTENVLPDAAYFAQPMPSMQKVWVSQSIEKELESKSKAQPVFDVASRTRVSVLPLTAQDKLALLQIGQAACTAAPAPPTLLLPSLSATPPQPPASDARKKHREPNPEIRRTTG
jgi:hypothetical protein